MNPRIVPSNERNPEATTWLRFLAGTIPTRKNPATRRFGQYTPGPAAWGLGPNALRAVVMPAGSSFGQDFKRSCRALDNCGFARGWTAGNPAFATGGHEALAHRQCAVRSTPTPHGNSGPAIRGPASTPPKPSPPVDRGDLAPGGGRNSPSCLMDSLLWPAAAICARTTGPVDGPESYTLSLIGDRPGGSRLCNVGIYSLG